MCGLREGLKEGVRDCKLDLGMPRDVCNIMHNCHIRYT